MSRRCELTGVGVLYGNNVSHSERKTRRRFEPNIKTVRFISVLAGMRFRFKVNANCIRTVEKAGGLDEYMLKASDVLFSNRAKAVKKAIVAIKKARGVL